MGEIGWNFPPTNGGMQGGINDAGIVTFDGQPLESLAREVIQNSVDARLSQAEPVKITFELETVAQAAFRGAELAEHLRACAKEWDHDPKASAALQRALDVLEHDPVTFLKITDANTTGLEGEAWATLVKMAGASFKPDDGAGGSYGVGKSAPFAVSPLRMVCYWSAFEEDGAMVEQFQGKAILVKHDYDFGEGKGPEPAQNIGFFGKVEQCEALVGSEIPSAFQPPPIAARPSTSIWVAGFNPQQHDQRWQDAIAQSIVESFFYAIDRGDLDVVLEPDGDHADRPWHIDASSIGEILERYESEADDDSKIDEQIERSRLYWEMVHRREPDAVMEGGKHGITGAKLWIATEEDGLAGQLPNRLALIRGTGMLITDDQKKSWPGFRGLLDYAAVCVIDDAESNELLRRMENPAHDQFEPERLGEEERAKGDQALRELRKWIRDEIAKVASPPTAMVTEDVDELIDYFYAEDPGAFGEQGGDAERKEAERAFGATGEVRNRQPKRKVKAVVLAPEDDVDSEGGDGSEEGVEGGGGGEGAGGGDTEAGGGEGGGQGGTGPRGGGKGRRMVELGDVRVIHLSEDDCQALLRFTANKSGLVRLEVSEAGDYSAIARPDVRWTIGGDANSQQGDLTRLESGKRYELRLEGDAPLDEAAWQVVALEADES